MLEREMTLPSDPAEVRRVQRLVEELHEELQFDHATYSNLVVAISEALNNGILHGNRQQPGTFVRVVATQLAPTELEVVVKDQGPGFDWQNIPDPTRRDHLLKVNGRGIFLMKNLSQLLEFRDNGSTVRMLFRWQAQ
jgi:serine/threonine-protein kinase RsbW